MGGVEIVHHDVRDRDHFARILEAHEPDEIYHLAAFSSVGASWQHAELVGQTNGMAVLTMLEEILRFRDRTGREPSFYQASTSEMFGSTPRRLRTRTPSSTRGPYGSSKLQAHWVTVNYREAYGLFAVSGILFNHESPRRGENFVTRKITKAAAAIDAGVDKHVTLGNLDAVRDWGYAPEYVEGMWRMLQQDEPDDFVMATGEGHSVREFCDAAFAHVGLNWEDHVRFDESFTRPSEVNALVGDASKAHRELGWKAHTTALDLARLMVDADLEEINRFLGR